MHKLESLLEKMRHTKLPCDFEMKTHLSNLIRMPDLVILNKKQRTSQLIQFTVPLYHGKSKKKKKKNKSLELARVLQNLRIMKMTIMPNDTRKNGQCEEDLKRPRPRLC